MDSTESPPTPPKMSVPPTVDISSVRHIWESLRTIADGMQTLTNQIGELTSQVQNILEDESQHHYPQQKRANGLHRGVGSSSSLSLRSSNEYDDASQEVISKLSKEVQELKTGITYLLEQRAVQQEQLQRQIQGQAQVQGQTQAQAQAQGQVPAPVGIIQNEGIRRRPTFVNKGRELTKTPPPLPPKDNDFKAFDLKPELLQGVLAYGLERPAAIQQRAIPLILQGNNLVAQALPSNEKVATYTIPLLQCYDPNESHCFALILVPSNELALHIKNVISSISRFMFPPIECMACVGSNNIADDVKRLSVNPSSTNLVSPTPSVKSGQSSPTFSSPHIIVGTATRIHDLINYRALDFSHLKLFVADEAEKLMTSNSVIDLLPIIPQLAPKDYQTIVFSTKLPANLSEVTTLFNMNEPISIVIKRDELTLRGVKQYYVYMGIEREDWTLETTSDLLEDMSFSRAIVFCNSAKKVDLIVSKLMNRGCSVIGLKVETPPATRDSIIQRFKDGTYTILVAVEHMARMIDDASVSLVINYELPFTPEPYLSRIHCAGRNPNRFGLVINIVHSSTVKVLKALEQFYQIKIDELPMNVAELTPS